MQKKLPVQLRQHINKTAHKMALVAEADIRDRLTAQAMAVLFSANTVTEADLAAMTMTAADWQAMVMTPADWAAITLQAEGGKRLPPQPEAAPMLDVA